MLIFWKGNYANYHQSKQSVSQQQMPTIKTIHSSALKRIKCCPLLSPTPKLPNSLTQREGLMFQQIGFQLRTVWENNSLTKFVVKRRMPQPTTQRIWKTWFDNFINPHVCKSNQFTPLPNLYRQIRILLKHRVMTSNS